MFAFKLPGKPVPWSRPAPGKQAGRAYTEPAHAEYKARVVSVADAERAIAGLPKPIHAKGTPVAVFVLLVYASKGEVRQWHRQAPDVDNGAKLFLDGLNGIAYADDRQVSLLSVMAYHAAKGEEPHAVVSVRDLSDVVPTPNLDVDFADEGLTDPVAVIGIR